ncbi:tannase and feruloyl esterase-domain-containing protein [Aspergillus varians]
MKMFFSPRSSYPILTASAALGAGATSCTGATFASLTLPNIHILAVDTVVAHTEVDQLTNRFAFTKNASTEVCQVTVQYSHAGWNDTINTWIWLPMQSWNGRFVGMGGGGWVTGMQSNLGQPVTEGYSAASTDGGHAESASTASWALTGEGNLNWPLLHDFSAVSLDEATSLGKLATRLFYGSLPKYSYWNGCSTGGRQGHQMAQRFPNQYDGILAGSPAINWDKFIPTQYWPQQVMRDLDLYPSACELNAITDFAISACDELDGVKDGIISLPGLCDFDPFSVVGKRVQCSAPDGTKKISRKGAQFVATVWAGSSDSKGSALWYGLTHEAPLTGLGGTNCTSLHHCEPTPFFISSDWMTTILSRNESLDLSTISLEEYSRLFRASVSEFQSRVLELDPLVHDYYRFFPAPGVQHCQGGPGWYPGDSFQALVDWVEQGIAPDTLFALATPTATGDASLPTRTAYLCPYPEVMTYVGGDPDKASSFACK